jgi:two-component system, sensor histidine kinase PdtaS
MIKLNTTIILAFWFNVLFAQQTIMGNINKAQDWSVQNIDSALYYAHLALSESQKLDSPRLVFQSYRAIGIIQEDNNRLTEAQKAYESALVLADKSLPEDDKLTIYTDWAIIHKKLGQYKIAQEYHLLTIERAEKMSNWEMVEDGYHGLGTMYSMLSNFNQSIQYYLLSIQAAEKWGNKKGIVLTEQNISNIYMKAGNNEMALKNIAKTYEMAQQLGDSLRIAAVLKIYGNIKIASGDLQDALVKHTQAKAIFIKKGDKSRLAESYLAIGDIYFQLKDFKKAELSFDSCEALVDLLPQYSRADFYNKQAKLFENENQWEKAINSYDKTLAMTNLLGFKELARGAHLALGAIYSKQNKFELAYRHITIADSLGTLLSQDANQKMMTESRFKYDIEKRDLEIENQKKALEYSKWVRLALVFGFSILSILLIFAWRQMQANKKATKHIALLMKELHHRVKNNIQTIASMMRLQARQNSDPSVSMVLMENKARLETFSLLHQQLYRNENVESVNLRPFIESIISKLKFAYAIQDDKIKTHLAIENEELNIDLSLPIGLIINELITNSFKYAYPSVSSLEITIQINHQTLQYSDNGQSLPSNFDFEKNAGFGMNMITSFAQQIKGKYKFYQADGFHFDMIFAEQ